MAAAQLRGASAPANPIPQSGPVTMYEIGTFLIRTGMTPTRFGRLALRDPRFVFDMRRGHEVRQATASRVRAFMASQGGC